MSLYEKHKEVLEAVLKNDYYTNILENISINIDANSSDHDIAEFWNVFWIELPDSRAIHRYPFYAICDLAEGVFD